jgi:hypothetical protein
MRGALLMPHQDMPQPFAIIQAIVNGKQDAARKPEDHVDAFMLERFK